MRKEYVATEADFYGSTTKKRKNRRWLQWAEEIGLKPGDKWSALDYMEWVDAHYTFDR